VNDLTMLTTLVEQEPDNTIVAAMLTDELMDARDMLRSEAEKHVLHVQQTAAACRDLAAAAMLMVDGTGSHTYLLRRVLLVIDAPTWYLGTVLTVPGPERPRVFHLDNVDGPATWGHCMVTVGARWLLDQWDADAPRRERQRRVRRTRPKR
jgi:hypothetical protein